MMERRLVVLGGRTGSGKTAVLHALRDEFGAQVLHLVLHLDGARTRRRTIGSYNP